jgi:hypothetical protein
MSFPTWPVPARRDQRGAVLPSPVVLLSILAVTLAAVTYFVTIGEEPKEREITQTSQPRSPADDPSTGAAEDPTPEKPKKTKPPVVRSEHGVVVFNNTSTTGLAADVLGQVAEIGWNAIASDNWYGTIPATTVYFPPGDRDAAQKLALDLGVQRVMPADDAMSDTNLTVILTGALG